MSLKSKIEAVIYASEEPVTLPQLAGLLGGEADTELAALDALQSSLALQEADDSTAETIPDVSPTGRDAESSSLTPQAPFPEAAAAPGPTGVAPQPVTPSFDGEQEGLPASLTAAAAPDLRIDRDRERRVRDYLRRTVDTLMRDYAVSDRGIEIREVAGGFRMGTKPEYHDAVRGFVKSLKPALKLTLQALETLAVVAYKQPVTAAEISEIRSVDSAGVLGGLIGRKLVATAGRKQVIGRPMLYKTTKEFLVRFGLKDVHELPSMDEFERLASELNEQEDLPMEATGAVVERANARGDAAHIRDVTGEAASRDGDEARVDRRAPSPNVPVDTNKLPDAAEGDPKPLSPQDLTIVASVTTLPDLTAPDVTSPSSEPTTKPRSVAHPMLSNREPEL